MCPIHESFLFLYFATIILFIYTIQYFLTEKNNNHQEEEPSLQSEVETPSLQQQDKIEEKFHNQQEK